MNRKTIITLAAIFSFIGLAAAGAMDAPETPDLHQNYCQDVALWEAEAARGIDPYQRSGHPDWREIAADVCPGMRPAY